MTRTLLAVMLLVFLANFLLATPIWGEEPEDPLKSVFTYTPSGKPVNYNPWSFMLFLVLGAGIAFIVFRGIRPV